MKKKLSIILLLLVSFIATNVHAEETWPKQYTQGDFTFTINDVWLDFYEIDKNSPIIPAESETDYGTTTTSTTQSLINYELYIPKEEVEVPNDRFTITPEPVVTKLQESDTIFSKLNLNISNDYILEVYNDLVEDGRISPASEDKIYVVDVSVGYTLDSYPEKYKTIFEVDLLRALVNMYDISDGDYALDPTMDNVFAIDKMLINYNGDTNQAEVGSISDIIISIPDTAIPNENTLNIIKDLFRLDTLTFYENEDASMKDKEDYNLIFTNISDLSRIIDTVNGNDDTLDDLPDNPITSIQTDIQAEKLENIPNTGKGVPYIIYIISAAVILVGGTIIVKVLRQPKKGV